MWRKKKENLNRFLFGKCAYFKNCFKIFVLKRMKSYQVKEIKNRTHPLKMKKKDNLVLNPTQTDILVTTFFSSEI